MLKLLKILSIIVFVLLLGSYNSKAQQFGTNTQFSIQLLKDTLTMAPGQFGFNSVSITNHSNTILNLGSKINLPRGWTLLRPLPNYIEIQAGQSKTIPLRIKTSNMAFGGKNYSIQMYFDDPLRGRNILKHFYVKINAKTHWLANLLEPTKFSYENEGLPNFKFRIKNTGNRIEAFDVNFKSNLRLTYPSSGFQIILKPGADTLVQVGIRSRTLGQITDEIKIIIQARNTRKVLIQKLYIISNKYKPRETSFYQMPVHIKWMGMNLFDPNNIFQYLEADGFLNLADDKAISFRIRSNSFGSDFRLNNSMFQINYHTRKSNLSLGTQQDYMYMPIDGNGIMYDFQEKRSRYEIFALKGRYFNNWMLGIRQDIRLKEDALFESEGLYTNNQNSGVSSIFGIHSFRKKMNKGGDLLVRAGYSGEKANKIGGLEPGYAGGYSFYNKGKVVNILSNMQYFSKWFPGVNRGTYMQNHEINLHKGILSFGAFASQLYRKHMEYNYEFSEAFESFSTDNKDYGVQLGMKVLSGNLLLKASKSHQLYFDETNPEAVSQKLSLEYQIKKPKLEQMFLVSALKSKFPIEGNTENIPAFSTFMRGKIKSLGYISRFDYGPIFYFDFMFQQQTGELPVKHQHSLFYEGSKSSKIKARYSINYFSMGKSVESSLYLRSDIFMDLPKLGMSVNLFASINALNIKRAPNLSISITKALKMPVPFFKKYKTLKLAMYKDRNNNNIWDKGEEPVKDANILVNDKYLVSNEKGEVTMQHVEKKNYIINFSTVSNQLGWIPNEIIADTIHLQKNKSVQIPFKMSDVFSGKIKIRRADYSKNSAPDLEGLLILAKNEKGEVFKSITNKAGHFYFNLNEDIYTIEIAKGLFGNQFVFEETIKTIDLKENKEMTLTFYLKERQRQLRIKRQKN